MKPDHYSFYNNDYALPHFANDAEIEHYAMENFNSAAIHTGIIDHMKEAFKQQGYFFIRHDEANIRINYYLDAYLNMYQGYLFLEPETGSHIKDRYYLHMTPILKENGLQYTIVVKHKEHQHYAVQIEISEVFADFHEAFKRFNELEDEYRKKVLQ